MHKFLEGTGFVHESIGKGRRRRLVIGRGSAATTLPPNSRALPRSAISTNVCNGIERALGFTNKVSTLLHSNSRNDDLKLSAWRSPQYHIIHDTHVPIHAIHIMCMIVLHWRLDGSRRLLLWLRHPVPLIEWVIFKVVL